MNVTYLSNELVVFAKKNKPVLGLVCSANDDNMVVLSEDGREISINLDQIKLKTSIIINSDRKSTLRGYRNKLNEISNEVDLEVLWKRVVGSVEKISFNDLIEIYYGNGIVDDNEKLKIYWAVNKDKIYFKKIEDSYFPSAESEVNNKLWEIEKEKRKKEETSAVVKYFKNFIKDNDIESIKKPEFDKTYFNELISHYVLTKHRGNKKNREARSFVHQLGISTIEDATELMIKLGEWDADANPDLKKLEEIGKFSKISLDEAENIMSTSLEKDDLVDLTSKEIFTIDDENTEDIDDAISIEIKKEIIELGIHICNVAHYIKKGSSLDIEACTKGETVYIPDKHIDIFPQDLIRKKFSLFAEEPKLALSLILEFDKQTYEIKKYRFIQSVISISKNLSYMEVANELLKEKEGRELANIAISLRKKRLIKGAFILHLPELKLIIDKKGNVNTYKNYMNSLPHVIITELMILTNKLAAKFIKEHKVPSIFRVQHKEIPQEGKQLSENDPLYSIKVVKYLRPSIISTNPGPHRSLGLDSYVQVTSPIRRYFDLVVQRQIIGILEGNEWTYDDKELSEIITTVTESFRERRPLQKNRQRYWLYKYLENNIGQSIKGIVSYANETNLSVYLPDFFREMPVVNNSIKNLKEYDEVTLSVEKVNPLRKRLSLKVIAVN